MTTIADTQEAQAVSVEQTSFSTKITFAVHGAEPLNDAACRLPLMFVPESAAVTIYPAGTMIVVAEGWQVLGDGSVGEPVCRIMSNEDDDLPEWVEKLLDRLAGLETRPADLARF